MFKGFYFEQIRRDAKEKDLTDWHDSLTYFALGGGISKHRHKCILEILGIVRHLFI